MVVAIRVAIVEGRMTDGEPTRGLSEKTRRLLHLDDSRFARVRHVAFTVAYSRIRRAAAGHDVNPALGDPRGGSNAFRFCVSSATRESSQGQVVPRFRASLRHSGRALKIDSNQFYT